jgi:hypothetical protein
MPRARSTNGLTRSWRELKRKCPLADPLIGDPHHANQAMQLLPDISLHHAIRFDARQRRLWILGQRCHHGATGALITAIAGAWVARRQLEAPASATLAGARAVSSAQTHATHAARAVSSATALAALGSLLMLHDWKDHAMWFKPGPGT